MSNQVENTTTDFIFSNFPFLKNFMLVIAIIFPILKVRVGQIHNQFIEALLHWIWNEMCKETLHIVSVTRGKKEATNCNKIWLKMIKIYYFNVTHF